MSELINGSIIKILVIKTTRVFVPFLLRCTNIPTHSHGQVVLWQYTARISWTRIIETMILKSTKEWLNAAIHVLRSARGLASSPKSLLFLHLSTRQHRLHPH